MTGFCGVRVHVCNRRQVEVHSDSAQIRGHRRRDLLRELDVVDGSESCVSRVRASGPRLQPRHVAAFLVDPDEDVVPLGAQCPRSAVAADPGSRRSTRRGRRRPDLARASAAPSRAAACPRTPGRCRTSRAARASRSSRRGHPLTEPAVRPKAIFRCTSRKNTTTGIAVSVDAAISAPQSVFRLVPEK